MSKIVLNIQHTPVRCNKY